jgi:hypothetical protein
MDSVHKIHKVCTLCKGDLGKKDIAFHHSCAMDHVHGQKEPELSRRAEILNGWQIEELKAREACA